MDFLQNVSLQPFNTFGIDQKCAWFCELNSINDFESVRSFLKENPMPYMVLGGGSNVLLTKDYKGLVIKNQLNGIEVTGQNGAEVTVKAMAGEVWHNFVSWTIDHQYAGLENLSLIPGCVGAAPMQNIGAYGVEIKDSFFELEALSFATGEKRTFNNKECNFGYRESVFKRDLKDQYLITSVSFKLSTTPNFHTNYGAIQQELEKMQVKDLSIKAISQAVINIRSSKLPNPKEIGNAGSFFKNPVVDASTANQLKANHPDAPVYPTENGSKLAAGWLIEQAGWKGKTIDNRYGVHKLQALVLVNYGGASGNEVYQLSENILQDVKQKFGVELEREVNII